MKSNRFQSGRFAVAAFAAKFLLLIMPTSQTSADTLWYNGDFDGQAGYVNRIDTTGLNSLPAAKMFERFQVTDANGWDVTTLWSNNWNIDPVSVFQADWSIRSGMGTGNAGTILFAGTNSLTLSLTGRGYVQAFGTNVEYEAKITGLNIYLPPGEYWLNVTPFGSNPLISSTTGTNAVGTPTGSANPGLWWWSDGTHNYEFVTPGFSMGVGGTVAIPEPSAGVLTFLGGMALLFFFRLNAKRPESLSWERHSCRD